MITDPETADTSVKKNKQKSMVPFVNVSYLKAVVFSSETFPVPGAVPSHLDELPLGKRMLL